MFKQKYLKYKFKYLLLQKYGGVITKNHFDIFNRILNNPDTKQLLNDDNIINCSKFSFNNLVPFRKKQK